MNQFASEHLKNTNFERFITVWLVLGGVFALIGNAASDIWLIITGLLFLVFSALQREWGWLSTRWVQLALVFWLWLLFTSAISEWPSRSFSSSAIWIRFPIFAVALPFFLTRYPDSFKWMTRAILLSLLFLMVVLVTEKILNPDSSRLFGTWRQSTKIGWLVVGFGLPIAYWALSKIFEKEKAALWAIPLVCALVLAAVITGEIYVTLSFLLGLVLFVLFSGVNAKILASMALLLPVAILSLLWLTPQLSERFYTSLTTRIPWMQTSDYYIPWTRGLKIAELNPIFGVGVRNHAAYCYQTPEVLALGGEKCFPHPHQLYIQTLSETGIIGLGLFIAMITALLWQILKNRKSGAMPLKTTMALCLVATILWPISTYSHAFGQHKNFFTWFVIAWALALAQSARPEQQQEPENKP